MNKLEFLNQLNKLDLQDGNLLDDDAVAIMKLAKQAIKPNCHALEIGPWKGKSTACIAVAAAKENATLWTVDHFKGSEYTKGETQANLVDVLTVFTQNMKMINAWGSVVFPIIAPYRKVMPMLPANFFNFIYVDADNRYPEVKFLLQNLWKKLKNRGIICGRNLLYSYPDRTKEVDSELELEYSNKFSLHPGIIKAVHEVFNGSYERVPNSSVWYKQKA